MEPSRPYPLLEASRLILSRATFTTIYNLRNKMGMLGLSLQLDTSKSDEKPAAEVVGQDRVGREKNVGVSGL